MLPVARSLGRFMHSLQKVVLFVSDAHRELTKDGPNQTSAKLISSAKALSCSQPSEYNHFLNAAVFVYDLLVGEVAKVSF